MDVLLYDTPEMGIVVFERVPYWGPELKRQFSNQSVSIRECRSVGDLTAAIPLFHKGVAVVILDAAPAECLRWIGQQAERVNHSPIIVVASSEYAELEWTIREAGADAFLHDETCGHEVARICLRLMTATGGPPVAAFFQG